VNRKRGRRAGDERERKFSSGLFGLKVSPSNTNLMTRRKKLISYYTDKLKKYGTVLECHRQ